MRSALIVHEDLYELFRERVDAAAGQRGRPISDEGVWYLADLLAEQATSRADLERALGLARKARQMKPDEAAVNDTLGWIYHKLGDDKRARMLIGKALAAAPDNPAINYHLGMLLFKSGRKEEAREKLSKALESEEQFAGRQEAEKIIKQL